MQEYAVFLEENENLQRQFQVIFSLIKLYIEYIFINYYDHTLKRYTCWYVRETIMVSADSPGHSFPATQHIHLLSKILEVE